MADFLQKIVFGIQLGSVYALVALGYTMVYGVLRLINFAHSDVFMIGAFVGYYLANAFHLQPQPTFAGAMLYLLPVMLLTMIICGVLGLIIERLAYRPLRKAPRLTALITAIGVSLFLENGAQLLFGANPHFFLEGKSIMPTTDRTLSFLGATVSKNQLVLVCATLILVTILSVIVYRTKVGQAMRAVAYDADAASLMGIGTDRVISFTFGLGAALAGAGGMLFAALNQTKIDPLMGVSIGLKAFIAAVVGGIGSLPGAVLGGLLMGLSESFIRGSKASGWTDAVAFSLLIVVLLVRPAGLLGRSAPEKV